MSASLTRRQALVRVTLGSAAAVAASSCSTERSDPAAKRDAALRSAAIDRERGLLAAYDAALAARPGDALLRALRAEHATHLTTLDPLAEGPSPTPLPGRLDRAQLRELERSASAAHAMAAVEAGRRLAGVLASCSASEAAHATVLA